MYKTNDLKGVLDKYDEGNELEIRFKPYHKLDLGDFYKIKAKLDKITKAKVTNISTVYYKGGYREVNGVKQLKSNVASYIKDDEGYRVVLSKETEVKTINSEEDFSREKIRYSYKKDKGRYDLSIGGDIIDLEFEFTSKPTIREIEDKISEGFRIINGKGILYNKKVFTDVIKDYNRILIGRAGPNMDYNSIVKVVNLKYHHLEDLISKYVCAVKVDGNRYVMYCNGTNTFLLYPNYIVKLIEQKERTPFMLDGELVDDTYYISDVMMYDNEVITDKNLLERREYFNREDQVGNIKVISKEFYIIKSKSDFFNINKKVISSIDKSDGLIYTPIEAPYLVVRQGKNTSGLLYKWKPEDKLTIDLRYKKGDLYTSNGDSIRKLLSLGDITIDKIEENSIGEYSYKNGKFTLVKLRNKKVEPNNSYVTKDVWNDIVKPLDYKSIIGEGNKMLFKYHNVVKTNLINESNDMIDEDIICLDIGSGRLGDYNKWRSYKTIICIEPNEDNIKEATKRLGDDERVTIIKTSAENTSNIVEQVRKITKGKMCNVISIMLSLTFFNLYESNIFDTIEQCAAENCNLLVFTIDGVSFRHIFDNDIKFNGIDIKPMSENTVKINIDDSIVTEQIEYYVDIGKFIYEMCKRDFDMEYYKIANKGFMSKNEKEFSRLFVSFIMKKNNNNIANKMKKTTGKVDYSLVEVVGDKHIDKHQYLLRDETLTCSFSEDPNLARIITSSKDNIISCLLNTNNLKYQELVDKREDLVKEMKRELSRVILYKNRDNEYNYTGAMAYKFLNDREYNISKYRDDILRKELDHIYIGYMFRIIGCNCIVIRLNSAKDKLTISASLSYYEKTNTKSVLLYKIDDHYDILGVKVRGNFKVLFSNNDEIMANILENFEFSEPISISDYIYNYMIKDFRDKNEKKIAGIIYDEFYLEGKEMEYKAIQSKVDKSLKEYLTEDLITKINKTFNSKLKSIKSDTERDNPIRDYLPK